ncbi:hypothetical protein QQ045_022023 [Rhodiola kirilowii]
MHRIIHFCRGPPNQEFSGMLTCLFLLFMELNKGPIYMVFFSTTDIVGIMTAFYLGVILSMVIVIASHGTYADTPSRNLDILNAIQEMQKANYFTFIMLINMTPADLLRGNITFLMPSDKIMSQSKVQNVTDFVLRHAIPSPMLFNHLSYIPTDSLIPSLHPAYTLRVSNYGRLSFFLNNARLTSPNLCTLGMSFRCHGISDVLSLTSETSVKSCLNQNHSNSSISLPSPPISPYPSPTINNITAAAVGPQPAPAPENHQIISKSSHMELWTAAKYAAVDEVELAWWRCA